MLVNTTLMRREMMVLYVSRGEKGKTKEGRGEGNERLNTHLCLLAAVRK